MCVVLDLEWDISLPDLTYQRLTDKFSAHLKRTKYFTDNGLTKGKSKVSSVITANQAALFDRYGKDDMDLKASLSTLRKYWAKAGSDYGTQGGCPFCRSRQHSFLDCPALQQRGLKVNYAEANDTYAYPAHSSSKQSASGRQA